MNEIFEKIYNDNNTDLNENSALFEKVYTEAEMLNEMNPKLRALLAAGLIGTTGLGAVSCSMPTDDPTGYEQPAVPTVTFESLGVTPEHAARLAGTDKYEDNVTTIIIIDDYNSFIYKNNEDGFVSIEFDTDGEYEDGRTYIRYINVSDKVIFYIPIDMESDFDAAIAAYKAAHAE